MMMNVFSGGLPGGMWLLHILFDLTFLIGLVLFMVWLVQYLLKKKQLLTWAMVLLIIGIIGMVLTFRWNMFGMMGYGNQFGLSGMYQHMLDEDHEDISSPEEFRDHMLEEMQEHMGFE